MSDPVKTTMVASEHPCDKAFSATSIKNYIAAFFAQFGTQGMAYTLFSTYLSVVFTDYLGVNPAAIGMVLSVGVFIDMITDIIMGNVMDRVHTKWGKARHWFFWSALPVAICVGLMFMCPVSASDTAMHPHRAADNNFFIRFILLYSFTDPTVSPLTKYLWKNGYAHAIGSVAITTMAILAVSLGSLDSAESSPMLPRPAFWAMNSIFRSIFMSRYWSG